MADAMTITPAVDPTSLSVTVPEFLGDNYEKLAPFRDQVLSCDKDPKQEWYYYINSLRDYAETFGSLSKEQQAMLILAVRLCDEWGSID
jgi:hypothetical protein